MAVFSESQREAFFLCTEVYGYCILNTLLLTDEKIQDSLAICAGLMKECGYTRKLVMEDLRQIRASLPNHRITNERLKELADSPAKTYAISEISTFINIDPNTLGRSLRSFVMNTKNCSTYDDLKIARLRTKSTMDFPE
jgi:hypothetical protein